MTVLPLDSIGITVIKSRYAIDESTRAAAVKRLVDKWSVPLENSRYMSKKNVSSCTDVDPSVYAEWNDVSLKECKYSVVEGHNKKTATAIVHFPSAEKIASSVVEACSKNTTCNNSGHLNDLLLDKLFVRVICSSGGQFPVAGIVLEDMDGNSRYNNYCFRKGVTVDVTGLFTDFVVASNAKKKRDRFPEKQISDDENKRCINGSVERVWNLARLQGTTREDYQNSGGSLLTEGNSWMEVIGQLYKDAQSKDDYYYSF